MKIGYKLVLGYLLVASFASFAALSALHSYWSINGALESLHAPVPMIKVLEDLRSTGIRLVSTTNEIDSVLGPPGRPAGKAEEKDRLTEQELVFAFNRNQYEESLRRYADLTNPSKPSDADFLQEIRKTGGGLVETCSQFIALRKNPPAAADASEEVLKKRVELKESETAYLETLERALREEYEEMEVQQGNVHNAIGFSTRLTLLVTVLSFVLAIVLGVYISRHFATRISRLKEASENIGRGRLETQIESADGDEIGDLARSFNKMAGDLKASRAALSAAKDLTEKVLNSMVDFVVVTDMDLTITGVNKAALELTGYEEHELIGRSASILSEPGRAYARKAVDVLRKKGHVDNLDRLNLNKDGSLTPTSVSFSVLKNERGEEIGIICVGKDTSERRRQEMERQAINEIVRSAVTTSNLEELFEIAHRSIGRIISAENCFIALHNAATNQMRFEYWADELDQSPPPSPVGDGFTGYIMRTGQALLLTEEQKRRMCERGEVRESGSPSVSWMGVPLKLASRIIGVLAVQNYEKDNVYGERDLRLLSSVGDQLALAIERKQNEIKLKASEAQLNEAQRIAKLGSWQWDPQTNKVTWSEELYRIFGYEPYEVEPTVKTLFSCLPPEDRKLMRRAADEALNNKVVSCLDHQIIRPDGSTLTLHSNGKVMTDEDGRVVKMVGTCQDITEQKEAEKALRTSEEQHRLLFETNPQPVFVFDLETLRFLAVNEAAVRHYGYSREEFLGEITLLDIRLPEDIPVLINRLSNRAKEEEKDLLLAPSRHLKKDGAVIDVEITSHVLNFAGRQAEIVLVNDVTERKKIEEILRENEAQFRDLFDNAPIAYHELDSAGHFTRINKTEELLLGYTNEELKGRHPAEIIVEEISREAVAAKLSGNAKLEPTERTFIRKDGTRVPMLCTDHLIYDADGRVSGIRTTLQDITVLKKLEQSLRASEESYRAFVEKSTEGIWRFEFDEPLSVDIPAEEQIEYAVNHAYLAECNNAMAQMYGFDSAEYLRGMRLKDFLVFSDQTNAEYFTEFVRNNYRLNDAETHERDSSGADKYFLNNMVGIFEDGKIVSAWGTQRDVTERRQAEEQLRIFNEKLQQSNRELQDFAYVASHDLQEPLRKVQAFADRLSTKYADRLDATGLDYLERMRNAAGRMQTLIQDLLSFSRVTTKAQPFVPVSLEKITREVLSDLEVKVEETGAVIELENLPTLDADPSQMRQLIQNLVGNALKFHRAGVAPAIKISAETVGGAGASSNGNGNGSAAAATTGGGRQCRITVTDNGIGFDEKYLDKIFTVFQRLHGRTEYEGSGVGLAVCRKIVERHHGGITARSAPGEGASFIITLPFTQSRMETN